MRGLTVRQVAIAYGYPMVTRLLIKRMRAPRVFYPPLEHPHPDQASHNQWDALRNWSTQAFWRAVQRGWPMGLD